MRQISPNTGSNASMVTPWCGYHRGTIVGRTVKGFYRAVQQRSGIEVYDDEIEFD